MKEWGFTTPILCDESGGVIAGHGRILAAQKLGLKEVPVMVAKGWTDAQKKAYVIADNKLALNAGWDDAFLKVELEELQELGFDLNWTGFDVDELASLLVDGEPDASGGGLTDEDAAPEPPAIPTSKLGDIWMLGKHRVMCGDSTSKEAVGLLMAGKKSALIHADPPYGMGKEGDGVYNDNLYGDKLNSFQMDWFRAFRAYAEDNASVYIWGNSEPLWSLWFKGGLCSSERMTLRNEIVWIKGSCQGQSSPDFRSYAPSGERCLFFMLGEQGFNNNADNFWDGYEPIRSYLETERNNVGWNDTKVSSFFGFHPRMASHWFGKSQWSFMTCEQYEVLQNKAGGLAFKQDYDKLRRDFYYTRAYFNNTHESMTDAWEYARVNGNERHGHATPKPVEMMKRVMRSSLPADGLCVEPFGGSGSTLMGAETTGRICYTMELQPVYIDVIVKRWQDFTGKKATLEGNGKTFNEIKAERAQVVEAPHD